MMKKSIFAVAVASVLTLGAAQAETVLYGSIRYDYESKKDHSIEQDDKNKLTKLTSQRVSNLNDAGSRIGLKGSEDLGNNNAVIYNLEYGFDGMTADEKDSKFTTRLAILGLTGDWGTVTAGRQHNPFKQTVVDDTVVDDFNGGNVISAATQRAMTTMIAGGALGKVEDVKNADGQVIGGKLVETATDSKFARVGKAIAYTTPDFAGFSANAAIIMDGSDNAYSQEKNVDLWTINAKYAYDLGANGAILAKVGYLESKIAEKKDGVKTKGKGWGMFLGYSQDAFAVSASYADGNHKVTTNGDANKAKAKGWDLGASFSFGPNYFSTVRATYGESHVKVDGDKDKVKSWAVGFEQKLSTRTRAWVEYGDQKTKFASDIEKKKDNVISIGMRHDF